MFYHEICFIYLFRRPLRSSSLSRRGRCRDSEWTRSRWGPTGRGSPRSWWACCCDRRARTDRPAPADRSIWFVPFRSLQQLTNKRCIYLINSTFVCSVHQTVKYSHSCFSFLKYFIAPSREPPIANVIAKDFHVTGCREEKQQNKMKEESLRLLGGFIYTKTW